MSTANAFWRSIPRKSLVGFLLGVFLIFTTVGFANDIMELGRQPTLRYVIAIFLSGAFPLVYAFTGSRLRSQFWKAFFPLLALQIAVMIMLANLLPGRPQPVPMGATDLARLQNRLSFDGSMIIAAVALGYVCFVYVSVTEGRRYARVHAEMLLAAEVHRVLVPRIDTSMGQYQFCGRSFPSSEVGGDLVDVFEHGRNWIAYVADVSGHGVAPGVVMAMVKSAARMQLSSAESSGALLERLNSVLHPIKKPEMFVTLAYLACDGEHLEYSTAGHPPILHYHAASKEISEIECSNVPVGMFAGRQFLVDSVVPAPDDLFLMLTDGVLEVTNAKDEEFGLAAVRSILSAHAGDPPEAIIDALLTATNRHGRAADDRSLLLVKLTSSVAATILA